MNKQLKTNFKLLSTFLLLMFISLSCNNSINKNKPDIPTMNSENSIVAIQTITFKSYDERTKEFIPNRETNLKYNSQGGTIEANYFRLYSKEKTLWSNYQAKYSGNMMTEYTRNFGEGIRKTQYKFDADGKVLSTINLDSKDGNFIPTSREIFEWNDSLFVSLKTCSSMENECNESSQINYEYDSQGRKISSVFIPSDSKIDVKYFYNDSSSTPIKITKIPYEYEILSEDEKIIEIKKKYYDHYSQKMALEKMIIFKYDINDRIILIQEKTHHATEKREYLYDKLGNLAEIKSSTRSRHGLDQAKWVFGEYKEYSKFVMPAWFAEEGLFWNNPKFDLNYFIIDLQFEKIQAKIITSKRSFPSGYVEYWSKGRGKGIDKYKTHWIPYQKVEYKMNEILSE